MSRQERVATLAEHLRGHDLFVPVEWNVGGCDLGVRLQERLAFIRVVGAGEEAHLLDVWLAAQHEIARMRDDRYPAGYLPDLYLVLLTESKLEPVPADAQAIISDPYVCRKLVVEWADHPLAELLPRLPFWKLTPEDVLPEVPSPVTAMARLGYDPAWVSRLQERIRPDELADVLSIRVPGAPPVVDSEPLTPPPVAGDRQGLWRLAGLHLAGFRGYRRQRDLDLGADLVVIFGNNGTGKTSVCEAIEWALTGEIGRLPKPTDDAPLDAPTAVVNLGTEHARVTLTLQRPDLQPRQIARTVQKGGEDSCRVDGKRVTSVREALVRAVDARLPENASASDVRAAYRRYHFLDQQTSLEFLLASKPTERYRPLRLMLGTEAYGLVKEKAEEVRKVLERRLKQATELTEVTAAFAAQADADWRVAEGKDDRLRAELGALIARQQQQAPETLLREALTAAMELGLLPAETDQTPSAAVALLASSVGPALAQAQRHSESVSLLQQRLGSRNEYMGRRQRLTQEQHMLQTEREALETERHRVQMLVETLNIGLVRDRTTLQNQEQALRQLGALTELQQSMAVERAALTGLRQRHASAHQYLQEANAAARTAEGRIQSNREARDAAAAVMSRERTRLTQWQAANRAAEAFLMAADEYASGQAELVSLNTKLSTLAPVVEQTKLEREQLEREQAELRAAAAALRITVQDRHALIAALEPHIDNEHCPLCRWRWESVDALRQAVHTTLSAVPAALTGTESQLKAVADRLADCEQHLAGLQSEQTSLQAREATLLQSQGLIDERRRTAIATVRAVLPDATGDFGLLRPLLARQAREQEQTLQVSAQALQTAENALAQSSAAAEDATAAAAAAAQLSAAAWQEVQESEGKLGALEAEVRGISLPPERKQDPSGATVSLAAERNRLAQAISSAESQARLLTGQLAETDGRLEALAGRESTLASALAECEQYLTDLRQRLTELELPLEASAEQVSALRGVAGSRLLALEHLADVTPVLSLYLQSLLAGEAAARAGKIAAETEQAKEQADRERGDRQRLLQQCAQFCAELGEVGASEEKQRLKGYSGTMDLLYQRLSAHPLFPHLEPDFDTQAGSFKLQVAQRVGEPVGAPDYFSTAQLNIVTLSIFIAAALQQNWSSLATIILDDPVQHMDDLNAYSLLDLLRSLAELGRQVIVTTANAELYRLMLVKYAPLNSPEQAPRFRAYRLRGISEDGPEVIEDTDLVKVVMPASGPPH